MKYIQHTRSAIRLFRSIAWSHHHRYVIFPTLSQYFSSPMYVENLIFQGNRTLLVLLNKRSSIPPQYANTSLMEYLLMSGVVRRSLCHFQYTNRSEAPKQALTQRTHEVSVRSQPMCSPQSLSGWPWCTDLLRRGPSSDIFTPCTGNNPCTFCLIVESW